ncbi:MAG: alkaline phosphatase family protein [Calditrichaeota bacterium]|nr:MAG: alkaline phosphatase family protein [Calditrichota bacterium]
MIAKKYRKSKVFFVCLLMLFIACSREKTTQTNSNQTVLLVSIDGFRWDYFEKCPTPNFDKLARKGVKAERLIPVFPTLTFPNHYSIITGLYPENHGIVSNYMYDPVKQDSFSIKRTEMMTKSHWWDGEPLWITAGKHGLRSASFFWVGSETAISGVRPTIYKDYDSKIPGRTRIDTVLSWLDYPTSQRPQFITLYFSFIDHIGHTYGPESPEIVHAVSRMDSLIGYLVDGLGRIDDNVNTIILSDHGMAETRSDRIIEVDDYIDLSDVVYADWYTTSIVLPKAGKTDKLYNQLHNAHPHLKVFKKEHLPGRFHFKKNNRIHPLVLIADTGWEVMTRKEAERRRQYKKIGGAHGYDNSDERMHGIFIAFGPAFRQGSRVSPFLNIHIYELVCKILGIVPAPNDGSLDSVKVVLKKFNR